MSASRPASSSLLDAAISYAERGWPVHPCNSKNKRPLLPQDLDHDNKPIRGSGGVTKATTDVEQIRAWWRKWPNAMVGIATGHGMFVVDFDPRIDAETGEEWTLDRLKTELEAQMGCALPATLAVRTPSGGIHLYFAMPDGDPIRNRGNLPDHVDVRGKGGYVVGPPSYCEGDGKNAQGAYRWLRNDDAAAIEAAPAELVTILRTAAAPAASAERPVRARATGATPAADVDDIQRRYAMRALDEECRILEATPEGGGPHGGRNRGIYFTSLKIGSYVGAGALSMAVARASIEAIVRAMPNNRDLAGALQTMENGLADGEASPKDLSAVGAQRTRGRDSGRSASSSSTPPPFPPDDAYAADALDAAGRGPAPRDDDGDDFQSFQDGSPSPANQAGGSGGRIAPAANPDMDRLLAFFAQTDLGNAERFRERHGWRFRFCNELGWFIWDDRRWELLSEEKDKIPGRVSLAVYDTVRAIRNEADLVEASGFIPDHPESLQTEVDQEREGGMNFVVKRTKTSVTYFSDTIRAHAKSSEGSQRIQCIANMVKAFGSVAIRAEDLDRDRMAINVLNGTLRISHRGNEPVMRLDPHNPKDLISKIANVVYDPKATCPSYDGFLAVVQPDEPMRRFLHQWGGLNLTGDISEQKLAFFHGKGRNGKSTLVDAWSHVAGDYGGSIGIESFLDQGRGRKGGEATPDLARLPGIRFLRTSEPEKGAKLAEALIKVITGGEELTARLLNKGFFSFLPSFKVTISGNHKPKITGHDDGIWRRVMLVPWDVQIAKEAVDRDLPAKLRKEASGMLNRLLEGLIDWRMHGLVEPDVVVAATAKYREQSDQLGRFLDECTILKPGSRAKSSALLALFAAWSKATGAAEWQPVGFSKAMEDRGFEKKTSNGIQWLDIEMTKSVEDYVDRDDGGGSRGAAPYPDDWDGPA